MSNNIFRWGILGANGYIAKVFRSAADNVDGAHVTRLGSAAPRRDDGYVSYEDVVSSEDVDCVYIALPNSMHFEWARKALEAGKHVLVEKPICLNQRDAESLFYLAQKNGLLVDEGYMYRHHRQFAAVSAAIASGLIGHVAAVRSCFAYPVATGSGNIRLDKALGGGALFDVGCYVVDCAIQAFGRGPKRVRMDDKYRDGCEVATTSVIALDFGGDGIAIGDASIDYGPRAWYEVQGEAGCLRIENAWAFADDQTRVTVTDIDGERALGTYVDDHYANEITHFGNLLATANTRYRPPLWQPTLATLEAATHSEGRWVDV